jgi:ABC-type proline/glycine betaine transport system ATPase subunit
LGKTVVFVTHDVGEALLLGSRIALMENGRMLSVQTPKEFLNSQDPKTKAYVDAFSASHRVLEDGR